MNITVTSGKGDKARQNTFQLTASSTGLDLKRDFAKESKKSIYRLSFKHEDGNGKATRLDDDNKTIESYGLVNLK